MKFWIILMVLFNVKLIIAYVYCDSRTMWREKTAEELAQCLYDYNEYDEYSDNTKPKHCDSDTITDFSDSTTCTVFSLESNESLNIEGPSLKRIKFKNSSISRVPPNFFKAHPLLHSIYINNCHVNDIDLDAFQDLENLQSLYLENNNITEIKKGIFNLLKNLTTLDISGNQITTIEKASFQGLKNLHKLNISHNKIQNIFRDMFETSPNSLMIFDLSHNIISTVELQAISNLFNADLVSKRSPNLLLDLSFNKLKSFNFSQLTVDLEELNLDNNNLDTLSGLMNSKSVKVLRLGNNRLSKFSYKSKSAIRYLNLSGNILQDFNISLPADEIFHTLDVSQNLIEKLLPNILDNMSTLFKLYINNNRLTELPLGLFKNLKNLQILNLSGNRLKRFDFGTFSGLSNLLGLDISGNLLTRLDYKTLHSIKQLTVLNIANNELTTVNPYDIINHCRFLQIIVLDGNPWKWNCESLLNFTAILQSRHVKVVEGSNRYIQNHLGHACYDSDGTTENPSNKVTVDHHQLENEIKDLRKLFKFEFHNSSFYHFFQNYKNHTMPSQNNINPLDDYFNHGFENSSFYRYFNKNFSMALLKTYEEGFHNLTSTMNLLNLKLSNISQTNLVNSALLNNASQVNLKNYDEVISNFSHDFVSKYKRSEFYKSFDKNFTKFNALNKSTVDLLNANLEKFSKSVDDISKYFEKKSDFYKLFPRKFENSSSNQVFLNEIPAALTSNPSYQNLAKVSERNQDMAQQIQSLRGNFITFMVILITILLVAMLLPVFKKYAGSFLNGKANVASTNIGASESMIDLHPLT